MSNQLLISKWGCSPNFSRVLSMCEIVDKLPEIRTFFGGYNNPIGIEVEAEGIVRGIKGMNFWTHTEDGSLKDHGREFISIPLSGRQIDYALEELREVLAAQDDLKWSVRTSIHVHQNTSTLREKHLMAYVMVYGLFENLFFAMCQPYRRASAFAYPVTALDPADYMMIQDSNKYCALNLAPIKRQATLEFRHMHGNSDFRLIRRWIQLIVKLHNWIEKQSSDHVLDTVLEYIQQQRFVPLAKAIWGVNSTLFDPETINNSGRQNALWALCVSQQEFR